MAASAPRVEADLFTAVSENILGRKAVSALLTSRLGRDASEGKSEGSK